MNRKRTLTCATAIILASTTHGILASSNCRQSFTFLARTRGSNPVFWIAEDIGGQCSRSHLHQIICTGSRATLTSSDLELQDDWDWLRRDLGRFMTEEPLKLVRNGRVWKPRQARWLVEPPGPRKDIMAKFDRHIQEGGSNARTWNGRQNHNGILIPELHNITAQMVYYYPGGLYIDYDICDAYYFPKSGYILVFTRQRKAAVGFDTMHGFLLLRRSK
ncbi:MAG: hypothetical protein JSW59_06285 [Phycisphaerales bacterium]|nr:MAG: hypothetical protein JSW59_06285 [Phycisphaerales bacterium]